MNSSYKQFNFINQKRFRIKNRLDQIFRLDFYYYLSYESERLKKKKISSFIDKDRISSRFLMKTRRNAQKKIRNEEKRNERRRTNENKTNFRSGSNERDEEGR